MDATGSQKRVWGGALNDSPGEVSWAATARRLPHTVDEEGLDVGHFAPLGMRPTEQGGRWRARLRS